ncbi:putative nucleic acid-binding protein [Prosthecobacter fusiformis]|uniref:Putative nucleic acid-binding protein n=1 Tax=Prosthecobacter fusiformis TaxID=48464 RepID=A0A4R7RJ08_9BACT|nr:PIN domain-containing protein [Prosthecobacter fusiformis]TDU64127.1 putative nucleic acid-binding protein [Prosthecobacter fusiformis]
MTVVVDINVLLDVFQRREPYYAASAAVLNQIMNGRMVGICPAHGLTTLFYLARRHGTQVDAEAVIDRVLEYFEVVSLDKSEWERARSLPMDDFEDAAIAVTAEKSGALFIVTRNEGDFVSSPVPAVSPASFLSRMS